jgi:hypothetical protein
VHLGPTVCDIQHFGNSMPNHSGQTKSPTGSDRPVLDRFWTRIVASMSRNKSQIVRAEHPSSLGHVFAYLSLLSDPKPVLNRPRLSRGLGACVAGGGRPLIWTRHDLYNQSPAIRPVGEGFGGQVWPKCGPKLMENSRDPSLFCVVGVGT